jgi:hypothetical protein
MARFNSFRLRSLMPLVAIGIFVAAGYQIIASQAATNDTANNGPVLPAIPQPVQPRACPPVPAYPDEKCTGVPPDAKLTNCSFTNLPGAVFDSCIFSGTLWVTAPDVTIKNSRINGVLQGDGAANIRLTLADVEIDGKNSLYDGIQNIKGYSCTRCHIHDAAGGFSGTGYTVVDSYVHSLYGTPKSYNEPLVGSVGDITVRHSRLLATWNKDSKGGTMGSAAAFYTHGTFWPPLKNLLFEQNYLLSESKACLYAGDDPGSYSVHEVSNAVFRENVFHIRTPNPKMCGTESSVTAFFKGNGNVWQNNRFEDGSPVNP